MILLWVWIDLIIILITVRRSILICILNIIPINFLLVKPVSEMRIPLSNSNTNRSSKKVSINSAASDDATALQTSTINLLPDQTWKLAAVNSGRLRTLSLLLQQLQIAKTMLCVRSWSNSILLYLLHQLPFISSYISTWPPQNYSWFYWWLLHTTHQRQNFAYSSPSKKLSLWIEFC